MDKQNQNQTQGKQQQSGNQPNRDNDQFDRNKGQQFDPDESDRNQDSGKSAAGKPHQDSGNR